MGAYGSFLVQLHRAHAVPIDHNQRMWTAARQAEFQENAEGSVPVLYSPMSGYLLLSASLQEQRAVRLPFAELPERGFYVDSRSLMRSDPKTPHPWQRSVLSRPVHFVSPVDQGLGVLQVGESGSLNWGRLIRFLNRLFSGNEYRLVRPEEYTEDPFRRTVWFSFKPFSGAALDEQSGLYFSVNSSRPAEPHVRGAVAVLPDWMSLQAFRQ
jgi:hypothetical protein